jgi:hypothetical protein
MSGFWMPIAIIATVTAAMIEMHAGYVSTS